MRKLVRGLAPQALQRAASRVLGTATRYTGPYASWEAARAQSQGYDANDIVARVEAATLAVLEGRARFEQDGVAFGQEPTPTPSLSGLLLAAALGEGKLSVVDFGGGLGGAWFRWKRAFDALASVDWLVVEQESFVRAGEKLLGTRGLPLRFTDRVPEPDASAPTAVLIGSSLQYVEDSSAILSRLAALGAKVLVLDRIPYSADDREHILVQHVAPKLYPASYPIRLLSKPAVDAELSKRYRPLAEFDTGDAPVSLGKIQASFSGSIWLLDR